MKCPEWLLEAMRKGEGVKCLVWDDGGKRVERIVVGFTQWQFPFVTENGPRFKHAEPYTEPAHTFKPDELVLARNDNLQDWCLCHFSHIGKDGRFCVGSAWAEQCIPYKGNESLLGTDERFVK